MVFIALKLVYGLKKGDRNESMYDYKAAIGCICAYDAWLRTDIGISLVVGGVGAVIKKESILV